MIRSANELAVDMNNANYLVIGEAVFDENFRCWAWCGVVYIEAWKTTYSFFFDDVHGFRELPHNGLMLFYKGR